MDVPAGSVLFPSTTLRVFRTVYTANGRFFSADITIYGTGHAVPSNRGFRDATGPSGRHFMGAVKPSNTVSVSSPKSAFYFERANQKREFKGFRHP
jgi:hypothetical protein